MESGPLCEGGDSDESGSSGMGEPVPVNSKGPEEQQSCPKVEDTEKGRFDKVAEGSQIAAKLLNILLNNGVSAEVIGILGGSF